MHDFPYDFSDVMFINGLPSVSRGKVSDVTCPFCGKPKKMNINNQPGKLVARCNRCGWSGGMLKFHADLNGYGDQVNGIRRLKYAKQDIEAKLSLDYKSESYKVRSRQVKAEGERIKAEEVTLPLEERSRRYKQMSQLLKLEDDHFSDLRKRGLSASFIEARGYKSLPVDYEDRYSLARRMHTNGYSVKFLPGFFMDNNGDYCLKAFTRGYLIPLRNLHDEIEGFQIRKDNDKIKKITHHNKNGDVILDEMGKPKLFYSNKFSSLSSPTEKNGGKMHSVCHYAGSFVWDDERENLVPVIKKNSVKFTEGALKADCYYFLTGEPILGILGVDHSKQLKARLLELKELYPNLDTVEDCLDMDYLENANVEKAMFRIQNMVEDMGFKYVRKTWPEKYKGVDDFALAFRLGKL